MKQATFHEPIWFILFALFPVIAFLHLKYWRHRHPAFLISGIPGEENRAGGTGFSLSPPDLLFLLRIIMLSFLILALADFRTSTTVKHEIPAEGIDIVLAMDISASMMMEDIKPNRLEALRTVLARFVAGRSDDRMGLVLYAGESINWCPLTKDYPFLLSKLNLLDKELLADGTAIGLGLASAVNALKQSESKSKVIILLTDGENNTGFIHPLTAAELAEKYNIKVYTIGIGTNGMAPLPLYDMNGKKVYHYVPVKIDEEMLKKIAVQTGGSYFRAQDAGSLQQIYTEIDSMEKSRTGYKTEVKHHAEYRWFLLAAMLFFMLELALKFTFLRTFA